jgi:hypothetical protein
MRPFYHSAGLKSIRQIEPPLHGLTAKGATQYPGRYIRGVGNGICL